MIATIVNDIEAISDTNNRVFQKLLTNDLQLLSRRVNNALTGSHLQISGTRSHVIQNLLHYLSHLKENDYYYTITTPRFWHSSNLGADGRFLALNKMLAIKGVSIRRVFLITESDMQSDSNGLKRIIEAQQRIINEIAAEDSTINLIDSNSNKKGYYVGFRIVSEDEQDDVVRNGDNVGLTLTEAENIRLIFTSKTRQPEIRNLELRKEEDVSLILERMNFHIKSSLQIGSWPLILTPEEIGAYRKKTRLNQ